MTQRLVDGDRTLADCTAKLVMAYITKNHVPVSALLDLIASVQVSLSGLGKRTQKKAPDLAKTDAQIRESITTDALYSFIDGKPYRVLRRHLRTHGLDAPAYRRRYGLPLDYPVVAPSYSSRRAEISRGFRSRTGGTESR